MKMKNGKSFIIKEAFVEDAPKLLMYLETISGESDNLLFGPGEFEMTLDKEEKFLQMVLESENDIMYLAHAGNEIIGCLSYSGGHRNRIHHCGEFGVSIKKAYWNQGVGRALIEMMIEWAEKSLYCEKINLRVREDNVAGIALYKKLGFSQEGLMLKDMKVDGKFYNCVYMGRDIKK